MKTKLILFLILGIMLCCGQFSSCKNQSPKSGGDAIRNYYNTATDSLLGQLSLLDSSAVLHASPTSLQQQFAQCRFTYKKIEAIAEYYFQGLTKRINGPALPDIKTEDGQVWPPHGFQVIEQLLYSNYTDSIQQSLSGEIKLLQTDLRFMRKNMEYNTISANHTREMIRHQFIRIAALGITGFDAPLSKLSLKEAEVSLESIHAIRLLHQGVSTTKDSSSDLLNRAINYLHQNSSFDDFNRMLFITDHLMPLSEVYDNIQGLDNATDSLMVKPFNGTLAELMKGGGFDADYYASYANAKTNAAKIELGKKLFFDSRLSSSGKLSCASCHQPGLYFTDGKDKAANFVHGGTLARNTPSLYYTALQSHQFYDLRSVTLEDQANEVMKNSNEFNFTATGVAKKLLMDTSYLNMFSKAFGKIDANTGGYEVRNALAAFVRSLSPFSSSFDEYMKGNKSMLSEEQVAGFNLFAGKAKCATCHFIPLFNGNIPPWYTRSESEIIGVPASPAWIAAKIDPDSGRFKLNQMQELLFAFKTPGIRNIDKTGPYMHNGVYNTLEEVVKFYHKGGGVGLGIDLPFQSLPFDSLSLNSSEQKAIVSFMKSLTDKAVAY